MFEWWEEKDRCTLWREFCVSDCLRQTIAWIIIPPTHDLRSALRFTLKVKPKQKIKSDGKHVANLYGVNFSDRRCNEEIKIWIRWIMSCINHFHVGTLSAMQKVNHLSIILQFSMTSYFFLFFIDNTIVFIYILCKKNYHNLNKQY